MGFLQGFMSLGAIIMRNMSEILKRVSSLETCEATNAQYWVDVNLALKKGFELPVPQQNILDEINGSFTEQFRNQEVDISTLDLETFEEFLDKVDLSPLGGFITHQGIDHHYHVNTGVGERNFHLHVDLKCIPTTMDEYGSPVASVCFIAAKIEFGERSLACVKTAHIGPEGLLLNHRLVLKYADNMTNNTLGAWLRMVRELTYKEHLALIEYQKEIH